MTAHLKTSQESSSEDESKGKIPRTLLGHFTVVHNE